MSTPARQSDDVPKSYRDILEQELDAGRRELERPASGLALSGLSAGLDMGFGPLLMAVMLSLLTGALPKPVTELLMAVMYSIGFLFVVLGRTELFTEHTALAVLPVLDRNATLGDLARLWAIVYVTNVLGGAFFAALAVAIAPKLGVVTPGAFGELASALVAHDTIVIVGAGVFAGWLMGLLSWLVTAAQDTTGRIIIVLIITVSIGLAHLPHCIAGNIEVLMGLFAGDHVTLLDYVRFEGAATLGNAIGGTVFVAALKYGYVTRSDDDDENEDADGTE